MAKNEASGSDAFAALRARFEDQSRRAQAYYTVMHAARAVAGSDDAASAWMEQPLAALGDRTPGAAVGAGEHELVLALIETLKRDTPKRG